MTQIFITHKKVSDDKRIKITSQLFGHHFPFHLEPAIYTFARCLCSQYDGAYWNFYLLSNGGFYMAPNTNESFKVCCENGYEDELTADAFGIVVCLYAYSHLSFNTQKVFAKKCVKHYHFLRDFMLVNVEASKIIAAID